MRSTVRPTTTLFSLAAYVFLASAPLAALNLGPTPPANIECFVSSPTAGTVTIDPFADGQWLQHRGNRKLTGQSPLIGNIDCPTLQWSYDFGARKHLLSVRPSDASGVVELPSEDLPDDEPDVYTEFGMRAPALDLDGDGYAEFQIDHDEPVGDFIPTLDGYERFNCHYGGECFLDNYADGSWQNVYTTEALDFGNQSYPIRPLIGDFDNDGALEVAILPFDAMHMFDLASGQLEQSGLFGEFIGSSTRGYGWFGAFNLDDDPRTEFVILGNFLQFISVIGWVDGELKELWDREIEQGTTRNFAVHEAATNPVADVDGDGRPDIVTSILNEFGDGRWHLLVLDALTGTVKMDLPDAHLAGLVDLDGDGTSEIFAAGANGRVVQEFGNAQVISLLNQQQTVLWSSTDEGFERIHRYEFPSNVRSGQPYVLRDLFSVTEWLGDAPVFATRERISATTNQLRFYQSVDGFIEQVASLSGPQLKVLSASKDPVQRGVLVWGKADLPRDNEITVDDLDVSWELSRREDGEDQRPSGPVILNTAMNVGVLAPDQQPTVLVEDYRERIHAIEIDDDGEPQFRWRVNGRGMHSGETNISGIHVSSSAVLAKLQDAHSLALIAAYTGQDSSAKIAAYDADGQRLWRKTVDIQGERPAFDEPGLIYWGAGHFRNNETEDVLIGVRRTIHTSEELHLLDGQTGSLLWSRDISGTRRDCLNIYPWETEISVTGASGSQMPVFDWDGDGLDDVLNSHDGTFDIMRGADGVILLDRWTNGGEGCTNAEMIFEEPFSDAPIIAIADVLGDDAEDMVFANNETTLAVLDDAAEVVWNSSIGDGSAAKRTFPALGDFSPNPGIELLSVSHCDQDGQEIRLFAAENGALLATLPLADACRWPFARGAVSADIDGDGYAEALFSAQDYLYAVGAVDGELKVLWRVRFADDANNVYAGTLGDVIIADVTGDGRPQILVTTESNHLYALGSSEPQEVFPIGPYLNDAWGNLETPGQGLFIMVFPHLGLVSLAWFTYDTKLPAAEDQAIVGDAGHRWLTATGPYLGDRASLTITSTSGGIFDAASAITRVTDGRIELRFTECGAGFLKYSIPSIDQHGEFAIHRAVDDNNAWCEEQVSGVTRFDQSVPAGAFTINPGLNDAWSNAATDGQGFAVVVFPELGLVSLAWFTYDTADYISAADAMLGDNTHRWLTAAGAINGNQATMNIDITSGGLFNQGTPVQHTDPPGSDGTLQITFHDCASATVVYDMPQLGLQGSIPIERSVSDNTAICEGWVVR